MANEFKVKKGLIVTGADGGTVVDIQGSQGQLFSVTDDLSGSIFAVSDISGVPILDVNSSGVSYFDGSLGIGTDNPNSKLHVLDGAAGTYTPYDESDTLVVESATPGGISLIGTGTGSASKQSIVFGTPSDVTSASILYDSNNSFLSIGTTTASNFVKFVSGNSVTALTLDAFQNATFAGTISSGAITSTSNIEAQDTFILNYNNAGNKWQQLFDGSNGWNLRYYNTTTEAWSSNYINVNTSGNTTFAEQAFSSATSSGDVSSTLTTKGYVDGLITGATIYRGAWQAGISATSSAATTASTTLTVTAAILDADGNTPVLVGAVVTGEGITGIVKVASVTSSTVYVLDTAIDATATAYIFSPIYGAPDLSGVTETSGYYYICSEAGSATPNGADSEPNTWNVGDWCIYNDVSGTGQWQKIDNSSVLSGVGTGQTVALWEGPSSVTDSETLGNAPITVSGSDTTFAGQITGQDSGSVQLNLKRGSSGTDGNTSILFTQPLGNGYIGVDANGSFSYGIAANLASSKLKVDRSGNATFAGTVTSPTFLGDLNGTINTATTGVTQTAGDNSTLIATTAYADAAAAAVPIGNYLPLSAGSSYPVTGAAYFTAPGAAAYGSINLESDDPFIRLYDNGSGSATDKKKWDIRAIGATGFESFDIRTVNDANNVFSTKLSIAHNGNATFAGNVTAPTFKTSNLGIIINNQDIYSNEDYNGNDGSIRLNRLGYLGGQTKFRDVIIYNGKGTPIATFDGSDQSATFAGNVTLTNGIIQATHDSNYVAKFINTATSMSNNNYTLMVDSSSHTSNMSSAGAMSVDVNSGRAFTITGAGNVGIGMDSPDTLIHAYHATDNVIGTFESGDTNSYINIKDSNSGTYGVLLGTTGDNFIVSPNNVEAMRITSTGKVGIGTTNPQDALDIDWDTEGVATDNSGIRVRAYRPHLNLIDRSGYSDSNGHNFQIKADVAKLQFNATSADDETFDLTRMVIDKDGNVGIGTTDPGAKLDVDGSIRLSTSGAVHGRSYPYTTNIGAGANATTTNITAGSTDKSEISLIGGDVGDRIEFKTNSTERMRIDSSGNVGIGTTSPGYKLTTYSTTAEGSGTDEFPIVAGKANAIGNFTGIGLSGYIAGNGAVKAGIVLERVNSYGTGKLHILNNSTSTSNADATLSDSKITILGNGNVGIGTTSPRDTLEIVGNMRFVDGEDHLMIKPNNAIHGADFIVGDGVDATDTPVMSLNGLYGGQVTIQTQGNTIANKTVLDVQGTQGQLFSVTDNLSGDIFSVADISGVPIMNVNSDGTSYFDGDVGIGTDSPGAKLEVQGTNTAGDLALSNSSTIVSSGDILGKLAFRNYDGSINFSSFSGEVASIRAVAAVDFTGLNGANTDLLFYTNSVSPANGSPVSGGSEKMRILANGNVGIGTTAPAYKLDVNSSDFVAARIESTASGYAPASILLESGDSDSRGQGIYQYNSVSKNSWFSGVPYSTTSDDWVIAHKLETTAFNSDVARMSNALFCVNDNGNVGIGTTSPVAKLHVAGSSGVIGGTGITYLNNADDAFSLVINNAGTSSQNDRGVFDARVGGSSVFRINNSGKVGIGTTSPDTKLDVISGTNNGIRISATDTTDNWRDLNIRSYVSQAEANALPSGSAIYTTNPASQTETAFSKYGGLVLQGRDDGNSSFAIRLGNGNGYATRMFMGATGVTTFSNTVTATNFILSSDERKKTKIKDLTCDNINVNWKSFELKEDEGEYRTGVIAQELEQSHPEFVKTDDEGFKSVKYIDLLIAKIAELEARLEKLEK